MNQETRLALAEQHIANIQNEISDMRELRETVALLKQSVLLLNRTVWGLLACVTTTMIGILLNALLGLL